MEDPCHHGGIAGNYKIDAHSGGVNDISLSQPNKQLCVVTCGDDKTIKVWDAITGVVQYTYEGHEAPVYSICPHSKENIHVVENGDPIERKKWFPDIEPLFKLLSYENVPPYLKGALRDAISSFIGISPSFKDTIWSYLEKYDLPVVVGPPPGTRALQLPSQVRLLMVTLLLFFSALANLFSDPQIAEEALAEDIVSALSRVLGDGSLAGKRNASCAINQLLNHFPVGDIFTEYSECQFVVIALAESLSAMDLNGVNFSDSLDALALLTRTKQCVKFKYPLWLPLSEVPASLEALVNCLASGGPSIQDKVIQILSRVGSAHSLSPICHVHQFHCIDQSGLHPNSSLRNPLPVDAEDPSIRFW
ncbi:Protein TOPLESS [Platanthera guangdongensis]|uniref:Protein TOPLESS n=1 Tax=Platanthera guangdongensis TaxID=2320717 RepID=A0ABR2MBU4_9ASPA